MTFPLHTGASFSRYGYVARSASRARQSQVAADFLPSPSWDAALVRSRCDTAERVQ